MGRMGWFDSTSEYLTSGDWWAVWFGLCTLGGIVTFSISGLDDSHISPEKWNSSPFDQEYETWIGFASLALSSIVLGFVALAFMLTAERKTKGETVALSARELLVGLGSLVVLCSVAVCLGKQADLRKYGLTEVPYGIALGLLFRTALRVAGEKVDGAKWLQKAVKSTSNGEFFIKGGIVLLALEADVVGELGLPGVLSSWPVVAVVILLMYQIGTRVLKMTDQRVVLVLAGGTAVCGASAATAVQAAVGAGKDDLAAVITVLSLFTILQMVGLPFVIREMGLPDKVAGAWIGGSIDATGAVVGAAEILDNDTVTKTAATLKVVQNAAIGFVVLAITSFWKPPEAPVSLEAMEEQKAVEMTKTSEQAETVEAEDPDSDDWLRLGTPPIVTQIATNCNEATGACEQGLADQTKAPSSTTNASLVLNAETDVKAPPQQPPSGHIVASWARVVRAQIQVLWKRFPKFVVGFFLMSALISILKIFLAESTFTSIQTRMKEASQWWFALGFTALGVELDPVHLVKAVSQSPLVPLYLVGQALDLALTLGASYLAFR
ncbi:hypothetical protein BSKO_07388 [Bryopsis sp. KO-2023]|nr:hypothetical protein BSKO_07388 [Bryopsis sp. KO-2023]